MKLRLGTGSAREAIGAVTWNFTGMFFSLVTGVLTARILEPSDRGLLALALTISSLSYLFSSVGTNSAVRTHQPHKPWASFRTYFQISAFLLIFNSVVVICTVLLFIRLGFVTFSEHVLTIAVLGALTFTSNQMLDMFNAAGKASQSAMANTIGHFATMSSLVIFFFFWHEWANLHAVLVSYSFSFGTRILAMVFLASREKFEFGKGGRPHRSKLLKTSAKFWGINLGQTLTLRSDQFLLGLLSSAYNVGIYAVAVTPASLMQVVANSIGQVAYREAATGSMTPRRLSRFLFAAFGLSCVYALFLWVSAPFLLPLVYGDDYEGSVPVVRILVIAGLLLAPYSILVRTLAGFNYPYVASISGLLGLVALVPSLFLMVPEYGATGAAFGVIIANSSMLFVVVFGVFSAFRVQASRRSSVEGS